MKLKVELELRRKSWERRRWTKDGDTGCACMNVTHLGLYRRKDHLHFRSRRRYVPCLRVKTVQSNVISDYESAKSSVVCLGKRVEGKSCVLMDVVFLVGAKESLPGTHSSSNSSMIYIKSSSIRIKAIASLLCPILRVWVKQRRLI